MSRPKPQTALLMASPDDAETQFYEALREGDLERLMAVWHDDEEAVCVHPGGPRIIGTRAIRVAFEAMFANGTIRAWPERIRRVHTIDSAVHSLVERIELATGEGPRTGWVMATNVYVKTALGWRIVLHHASPGSADEAPEVVEAPAVLH